MAEEYLSALMRCLLVNADRGNYSSYADIGERQSLADRATIFDAGLNAGSILHRIFFENRECDQLVARSIRSSSIYPPIENRAA